MLNPQREMQRAGAALRDGDARTAARACEKILSDNPRDVEARYLHGRCLAALGRVDQAAQEFRRVLTARADHFPALIDLGISLALAGEHAEALSLLERARLIDPRPAATHFGLGLCLLGLNDAAGAVRALEESLLRDPSFPDAVNNLGVAHDRLGRLSEAIDTFRRATLMYPSHGDAHRNLGDALRRSGDLAGAIVALQRAAQLLPGDVSVLTSLGAAYLGAGEAARALEAFEQALTLGPAGATTLTNRGEALRLLERSDCAAEAYAQALSLEPRLPEAYLGLGRLAAMRGDVDAACSSLALARAHGAADARLSQAVAAELEQLGRADTALELLERASAAQPENWELHAAAGAMLHRMGRLAEALDRYERSLDLDERIPTLLHAGNALESMGAYGRALATFEKVLAGDPENVSAMASMVSCALRVCDWDLTQKMLGRLRARVNGIDALQPFVIIATDWEPAAVAQSLRRRAHAAKWPAAPAPQVASVRAAAHAAGRLRVAYVSPDFRTHPVAYALAGVIERHDRSRIEPIAISLKAGDDSPIHARLRGAFDTFIDAATSSDRAVAELMRDLDVHIAIDLAGLTAGSRSGIFALRAAPVQVNYLGYPGSTGFDFMDYLVADEKVVPPGEEPFYAERVLRMPNSYLPFDDSRAVTAFEGGRLAAGLPPEGVVFCAFNNGFKIARPVFEIWMQLLHEMPGSVLWLRSMGPAIAAQLKNAAVVRGISADRLVFATFEPRMDRHLSRLSLADLFLDTLPYNAHTTASEALWVGVPVLSCAGKSFAGRVGASLLCACGLPDLISSDLEGYHRQALELARSPDRRAELRVRLLGHKSGMPAFDTRRYTRDFEALLLGIDPRTGAPGNGAL